MFRGCRTKITAPARSGGVTSGFLPVPYPMYGEAHAVNLNFSELRRSQITGIAAAATSLN